jgi:hypothetical protein
LLKGKWRESVYQGMTSIVGENDSLRVEIVPGRGGKIVSLIDLTTSREWVYRNGVPWRPLRYGMRWEDGDRSGWDEMFPTILACPCPNEPWQQSWFPDHGEVWTLPWLYEFTESSVRIWVHGVMVPYIFEKTYTLNGKNLITVYQVQNPTPFPFSYMWCAHNLLAIKPGMKWITDPRLDSVIYQYSHGNRFTPEPYGRSPYPIAGGPATDLSIIEQNQGQHAEKFWFERDIAKGVAGILDPETGEALTYLYSSDDVPYLAVWANYGVFTQDYTAALEPATGYLDDLYVAYLMKKVKMVQPYEKKQWDFIVSLDSTDA